jgi:CRISPR-associated protein Cas5d
MDRNENKHHNISKRMIEKGGRRDIFLGTRECQGYVKPCTFGEGESAYQQIEQLNFGFMYHGMTYADEAYSDETKGKLTANFWVPVMRRGIIEFVRPEKCPQHKYIHDSKMKVFVKEMNNFSGFREFGEEVN